MSWFVYLCAGGRPIGRPSLKPESVSAALPALCWESLLVKSGTRWHHLGESRFEESRWPERHTLYFYITNPTARPSLAARPRLHFAPARSSSRFRSIKQSSHYTRQPCLMTCGLTRQPPWRGLRRRSPLPPPPPHPRGRHADPSVSARHHPGCSCRPHLRQTR